MKKVCLLLVCLLLIGCFSGCQVNNSVSGSNSSNDVVVLNIAYQYGLAYAPLIICEQQGLIEEKYKEKTGKDVSVVWNQMSSGSDINTAIVAGQIDVGFMGVAPAITGVMKNVGYKIFTNLSGQEHGLITNQEKITSLGELIGSDDQIALVNIGSIQHIILAKALYDAGYDAHALDSNIVAMKHPDGMLAVENNSIACHLTTNPYIYKERDNENLFEIEGVAEAWATQNSFIVGVASEDLFNENSDLYYALCDAIKEAVDYINSDLEAAAKITYTYDGNSEEVELEYLSKGVYTIQTKGIFDLAVFMANTGFLDTAPESYEDLVFSNVTGS